MGVALVPVAVPEKLEPMYSTIFFVKSGTDGGTCVETEDVCISKVNVGIMFSLIAIG